MTVNDCPSRYGTRSEWFSDIDFLNYIKALLHCNVLKMERCRFRGRFVVIRRLFSAEKFA